MTDGILLPWKTEDTRGTIFVMAHGRTEAFDETDVRVMTMLADFAATGYRDQKQRSRIIGQERAAAAAQLANKLAHEINNPLQSMTNTAYMIAEGVGQQDPRQLGQQLATDLRRLSALVQELLSLPLQLKNTNGKLH